MSIPRANHEDLLKEVIPLPSQGCRWASRQCDEQRTDNVHHDLLREVPT
jgi:hypothetical protein